MLPAPPPPEVPRDELEARLESVRHEMYRDGIDILVLTGQKNIEYFTDYRTLSWAYNARPLFALIDEAGLLLTAGKIESRNLAAKERGFDAKFYDGYLADAVAALLEAIGARDPSGRARVAIDYGQDMFGRGCLELVNALNGRGSNTATSGAGLIWRTRMIKSPFEAALKRTSFEIVNAAFDAVVASARMGITETQLCRQIQAAIMENGADRADPIAMTFGRDERIYSKPPTLRPLQLDDYLWTDFRSTYGGYPADRNRIARCGEPEAWEVDAYEATRAVTIALAQSVRPGTTAGDVFRNFKLLWEGAGLPKSYGLVSRIGHGGGLDVTEPPSISRGNPDPIVPGMILHLEPKLELNGAVFQFEEVVYVRDNGVEFLSELSPEEMPIILSSSF